MKDCFVAIGGNKARTLEAIEGSLNFLAQLQGVEKLQTSNLYQTTPVSDIPQTLYLNAVCRFQSSLPLLELWKALQRIEKRMGKMPKPKQAPRLIDLDLLFYGCEVFYSSTLIVPHPRWHERLFVITPLADLIDVVPLPYAVSVKTLLKKFSNPNRERVAAQNYRLPYAYNHAHCQNQRSFY